MIRGSLVVQLTLSLFNAIAWHSIPDQGTKIAQLWARAKKIFLIKK